MSERVIAEVFPPGVFIEEELDARNWRQADLAEIISRSPAEVSALISGKRAISPEIAMELGEAFGTSAKVWMNLEATCQLHRLKITDNPVSRRAKLHSWPIREMVKRHWIEPSENLDVLEQRVKRFFNVETLEQEIPFACAARKATQKATPSHTAWLCRAKQLAHAVYAAPLSRRSFEKGLKELKNLLRNTEDVRRVPTILAESGIRFLIVEHLPGTKIDGVAFWIDDRSPAIVLSVRYDRIDSFWFTLAHELGHISRKDGMGKDDSE